MKRRMGAPKPAPAKVRAPRKVSVPFERHAALSGAVAGGKFLAAPGSRVYVWRLRAGQKPSWHTCEVLKVMPDLVELWDDTLGQCFGFNPTAPTVPDVRMEGAPLAAGKPEAAETVATTAEGTKKDA